MRSSSRPCLPPAQPGGQRVKIAARYLVIGEDEAELSSPPPGFHDFFVTLTISNPFRATPAELMMAGHPAGDAVLVDAYAAVVDAALALHSLENPADAVSSALHVGPSEGNRHLLCT